MGTVLDGVIYGLTGGTTVFNGIPKSFTIPGILKIADIPFITIVAVVLYLVFHIFMNHMAAGRKLYAIGGSEEAAKVAGIRIFRYRVLAFTLCAALAGLAGSLVASRVGSANTTAGQGYFLQAYAAVFIGCTGLKERCPVRRRNVSRNDHPGSSGKRTYDLADAEFHAEHHHRRDHHSRGCGPEAWSGEVDHVSSNL